MTASPPKLMPALLGGLFIGVLSGLPVVYLANCCCLWVITGGFLAAWLQQQNHDQPITVLDGAIVGLLAGFVGGFVHYLVVMPMELLLGGMFPGMYDSVMRSPQDIPPEARRAIQELGPQGLLLVASLVFGGIAMVFAMLGGIVGAVMIKKPSPPAPPVPPVRWGAPPPPVTAVGDAGRPRASWPPPPPPPADEKPPE